MVRWATFVTVLGASLMLAETTWAKGAIIKIVIEGDDLSKSIEIVDPQILEKFTIWSGPGVGGWDLATYIPKPDVPNFIIDWSKGIIAEQPGGVKRYIIRLYIEGRKPPRDTYEVMYTFQNTADNGYVYLPSPASDDFGQWNRFQINRRVEGNWFQATQEWDELAQPLINAR